MADKKTSERDPLIKTVNEVRAMKPAERAELREAGGTVIENFAAEPGSDEHKAAIAAESKANAPKKKE